jgi:arabinoxylan arabinofuranohydrolase
MRYSMAMKCGLLILAWLLMPRMVGAANPFVTDIYTADPAVHYFEGKYWVYTTHDEPDALGDFKMLDWRVYSSPDLKEWTDHGVVMHLDDIAWAEEGAWAPDVVEKDGIYYMYFPVDRSKIGVATSTSPTGPFVDALGGPLVTSEMDNAPHMTIDPATFIDDDGQVYMYFGNDDPIAGVAHGGNPLENRQTPRVVKLKPNMLELDSAILDVTGVDNFFEAPWMHKHNGTYYFTYACNGIFSEICHATSDSPLGPFQRRGAIADRLLSPLSLTNHHSTIEGPDGQWYFFYHTTELSKGNWHRRSVAVDKMFYNADGSIQKVRRTFMGVGDKGFVNTGETSAGYHHVDNDGNLWHKDRNFSDRGNIHTTSDSIRGTDNDSIYQVQRFSQGTWWSKKPLNYHFLVDNGNYEVKLHFAETFFFWNNARTFDIDVEGQRVYNDLDIHREAGHDRALVKTFNATVNDGELNIDLLPGRNNPTIAGIEIRKL